MSDNGQLPTGWCLAQVEDVILECQYGSSAKTSEEQDGVPVLRMGNIQDGYLDLNKLKYLPESHSEFPKRLLREGDLLFNRTNSAELVGKSAVYTGNPSRCSYASYLVALRLGVACESKFLCFYLNSSFGRQWVRSVVCQQVGQANVNSTKLRALRFPLAPSNEQRRIVGKIEELFSDLEAGVAALTRARANLKRYRASVLKAAVEGSLTAQWRVEAASRRLPDNTNNSKTDQEATTRQDVASTASTAGDDVGYFDPRQPTANLHGNLPHWRQEHVTYFVTFRLADSIPAATLELWKRERDDWLARNPQPHSPSQKREYEQQFVNRFHKWLDAGNGECVLGSPDVRQVVTQALVHFQNSRYLLREWVVMPNHVHVIVTPLPGHELSEILHSWKSFTAKKINKLLGKTGTLWQKESFDHIVRGPDQLERIERYIHNNPQSLPADRYTLGCIHDVEATSRRLLAPANPNSTDDKTSDVGETSEAGEEQRTQPVEAASRRLSDDTNNSKPEHETSTRQDAASTIEPASQLLDRILTERRRQWEADQLTKFTAAYKQPPKTGKPNTSNTRPQIPATCRRFLMVGVGQAWTK